MSLWMFAVACVVSSAEQEWSVEGPVERVEILARNGNVDVSARQRDGAGIQWNGGGFGTEVTPEISLVDGVLVVDTLCDGLCGGALDVSIPDLVPLTLEMDAGDASVSMTQAADVCVELGAGSVDLTLPGGAYVVDVEVGAGSIELEGVWDDAEATTTLTGSVGAGSLSIHAI